MAGLCEALLQDQDGRQHCITFVPAVMAIGETLRIVEREALAKLGETRRFGVEQVDGEARHRSPPSTRSRYDGGSVVAFRLRSRKSGMPVSPSTFAGCLGGPRSPGSSSCIGWSRRLS